MIFTESLEQQTATAEVLRVISASPGDLQPVFASMLENAVRICDASFGNFLLFENGVFRHVALQMPQRPGLPINNMIRLLLVDQRVCFIASLKPNRLLISPIWLRKIPKNQSPRSPVLGPY